MTSLLNGIALLDRIGFNWSPRAQQLDEMYGRLLAFKKKHGHCNVPVVYPPDPRLGKWARQQRSSRKQGSLSAERINLLDKIGFSWDPLAQQWAENYQRLIAFKKKHGHCKVPVVYPFDPALGRWAGKQRRARQQGNLSAERIALLDKVGFHWSLR